MHFDGAIRSMHSVISEAHIEQEQDIVSLIARYQADAETNPFPDMNVLYEANQMLTERLRERNSVSDDIAFLSMELTYHLDAYRAGIETMRQYLSQPLSTYQEAWARWHIIDFLAMLRKAAKVVEEQRSLVSWVRQAMPPEHRLFALSDSTQALCWQLERREEEWHELCDLLLEDTPIRENTRWERFYMLRTKFTLC